MELRNSVRRWLHRVLDVLFWVGVVFVLWSILVDSPVAALLVVLIYMVWKSRNDPHLFERVGTRIDQFLQGF